MAGRAIPVSGTRGRGPNAGEPTDLHASHSALANAIFWLKSRLLIARRLASNALTLEPLRRYRRMDTLPANARQLALDEHPVYTAKDPRERELELGKVQNLRVAAALVDGIVLEPGEIFSFWAAAGRPGRSKGYVIGRELRQGCMIPTIGGGICQLTNALSRAAHRAGMEIVERHSHTIHPPGFFIDDTTDATVFWNYIDFRFRSPVRVRIGAQLTETTLAVRLDALP
jgi:vancomycin resistance protein VanW